MIGWYSGLCLAAFSGAVPPATTAPAVPPAATQPAATQPAPTDGAVRKILEAMEARGDSVQTLKCQIEYTVEDLIGLSEFTRFGEIRYGRAKPNPTFLIRFDKTHEGGIVVRKKEWYLFRDRWLFEAKEASQTVIEREVVREGETIDLFSLEKAPFPIPFGQRKDEILRNFEVSLVPPAEGDPADTDHLHCVPRTGSRLADQYQRLEFYVDRKLHLPVKIVGYEADPVDRNGEPAKIVRAIFPDLTAASINDPSVEKSFQLPPETEAFNKIQEPLPPAAAPVPENR